MSPSTAQPVPRGRGGRSHLVENESTREGLPKTEGMGCQAGCPMEGRVTGGPVLCLAEGSPGPGVSGQSSSLRGLGLCSAADTGFGAVQRSSLRGLGLCSAAACGVWGCAAQQPAGFGAVQRSRHGVWGGRFFKYRENGTASHRQSLTLGKTNGCAGNGAVIRAIPGYVSCRPNSVWH